MDIRKNIGIRLKELREARGLTQEELKGELNKLQGGEEITRGMILHWERGTRGISVEYVLIMAEFFGQSTDYLLCHSDVPALTADCTAAAKYTGLSEKAIEKLHSYTDETNINLELFSSSETINAYRNGKQISKTEWEEFNKSLYPFRLKVLRWDINSIIECDSFHKIAEACNKYINLIENRMLDNVQIRVIDDDDFPADIIGKSNKIISFGAVLRAELDVIAKSLEKERSKFWSNKEDAGDGDNTKTR